jgi:hypothetical protein
LLEDPLYHNQIKAYLFVLHLLGALADWAKPIAEDFYLKLVEEHQLSEPPMEEQSSQFLVSMSSGLGWAQPDGTAAEYRDRFALAICSQHRNWNPDNFDQDAHGKSDAASLNKHKWASEKLNFNNCDARQWGKPGGYWEVCKAYCKMPLKDHATALGMISPSEMDISSLCGIISYCGRDGCGFDKKVKPGLADQVTSFRNNVLKNAVLHAKRPGLEKEQLEQWKTYCVNLLGDDHFSSQFNLRDNTNAQTAVEAIRSLRSFLKTSMKY